MGFWGNLFFQHGIGKAIDPLELTSLGKDKEGSNLEGLEIPTFQEDPDYRETQDYLKALGINILEGDIPDYYKSIGETGGKEFEDYLNLLKGDVQAGVESSMAAAGRTGGVVASQTAEKVGRLSTEARFQDYARALQGKEFLLGTGQNITEGVRGAGQAQQAQANQFKLNATEIDLRKRLGLDEQDLAGGEALGKMLEMGLGAAAGFVVGGPAGAVIGAAGGFDYSSLLKSASIDTSVGPKKETTLEYGKIKPYKSLKGTVA